MTAISGATPLTSLANGPGYIRIMSDALDALPGIVRRPIIGSPDPLPQAVSDAPDGTNCRIARSDYANMASLSCDAGDYSVVIGGAPGQTVTGRRASRAYFHGVRFFSIGRGARMWLTADYPTGNVWFYGASPTSPDHLIFNQCAWDPDINEVGTGIGRWLEWDGEYLAVLNSIIDKCYLTGGGENNLIHWNSDGWGPLVVENCEIPLVQTQAFLSGGGHSNNVGVQTQDNVWSRNWQLDRASWRNDYVRGGYTVQFTGTDATTIHCVTGRLGAGFPDPGAGYQWAVQYGCIMVEPATGKARELGKGNSYPQGSLAATHALQTTWPNPSFGTTISVWFQMARPRVVYNSGLVGNDFTTYTDVPVAHVTNGSTAVTFTLNGAPWPLPVDVQVGHYLYLNNLTADEANVPATTYYGATFGIARANCRRKRIDAIAGDRMSCTLEAGYIVVAGDAGNTDATHTTFPFTVSPFDGLWRSAWTAGKGSWETKCGASRMLIQGNVYEFNNGGGAPHLLVNMAGSNQNGSFTIAADDRTATVAGNVIQGYSAPLAGCRMRGTFNQRGWPYNGAETVYPYMILVPQAIDISAAQIFWSRGRIVIGTDFASTLTLEALTGFLSPSATVGPGGPYLYNYGWDGSPWWTVQGITMRYNLSFGGAHHSSGLYIAVNEETGEITKGKWANIHDNVSLLGNELAANYGGGFTVAGVRAPSGNQGTGARGTFGTCMGQVTGDAWLTRYSHNTVAHPVVTGGGGTGLYQIDAGGTSTVPVKPTGVDISDNLLAGIDTTAFHIMLGASGNPGTPANLAADARSRRNVLMGSGALTSVQEAVYVARFPDNSGVPTLAAGGFTGFTAVDATQTGQTLSTKVTTGQVDPMDMAKYALADIDTIGTVTVSGVTVTRTSGTWPAEVAAGQFFKTTADGTLVRIQSITPTTLTLASAYPTGGTGLAYAITFKGSATDGTDPGANLAIVEQYTRNVRTRAIP